MALDARLCLLCALFVVLLNSDLAASSRAFTEPGLPACYASSSIYQYITLYTRCPYYSTCSQLAGYLYCSKDHECCLINGCPACCISRNDLNGREVTGIVIGCVAFVFTMIGLSICISVKCCSKGGMK